jgi:pimeloyl-ACP methyl ester carboxylesterase
MRATDGYVTVEDGVRLFFRKIGDGSRTLIVLNGFYLFDDFKYLAADRTIIFLDLRNRGRSDYITTKSKLERGVLNDIDDIEAVRRYFDAGQVDLLAHSYAAKTVILYAAKYPAHVSRVVQIGAMKPDERMQYPAHLTGADTTLQEFQYKFTQLQQERQSLDPQELCRKFWSIARVIYVADPANAGKIHWDHCDLPTELSLMSYWVQYLFPSIQNACTTAEDLAHVNMPVLVVHGTKDRSAPYGGAREWAMVLPNARLLAVENAAHVPWIEVPDKVPGAIQTFLNGDWPDAAREVESI